MIAGAHDKQVPPDRVRAAYDDLGSTDKVLIDLGCSSHNAMWETQSSDDVQRVARVVEGRHRRRPAQRRPQAGLSEVLTHARQLRHRLRQRHEAIGRVLSRRDRTAAEVRFAGVERVRDRGRDARAASQRAARVGVSDDSRSCRRAAAAPDSTCPTSTRSTRAWSSTTSSARSSRRICSAPGSRSISIRMGLRSRSARNDDEECACSYFCLALSTAGCSLFGPSAIVSTGQLDRANTGDRFTFVCLTLQQNGDDDYRDAHARISDNLILLQRRAGRR